MLGTFSLRTHVSFFQILSHLIYHYFGICFFFHPSWIYYTPCMKSSSFPAVCLLNPYYNNNDIWTLNILFLIQQKNITRVSAVYRKSQQREPPTSVITHLRKELDRYVHSTLLMYCGQSLELPRKVIHYNYNYETKNVINYNYNCTKEKVIRIIITNTFFLITF